MDPVGGLQALQNLRLAGNENGRMFVIPNAGHQGKHTRTYYSGLMYMSRYISIPRQPNCHERPTHRRT